jgi:hypothetical protein
MITDKLRSGAGLRCKGCRPEEMLVTEAEWFNGFSYTALYDVIRGRATTRQVRLYMAACCRLLASEFFDPRITQAVGMTECCADDARSEGDVCAVWQELITARVDGPAAPSAEGAPAQAVCAAWQLLDEWWTGTRYENPRHALAHAAYLSLRDRPQVVFTGGDGCAAEGCALAVDCADSLRRGMTPEEVEDDERTTATSIRSAIADRLRDIFRNPFRRAADWQPVWLTRNGSAVLQVGRSAYDKRLKPDGTLDPSRLNLLADALEDAGCADADLLGHLRSPGPHVRGCWAVDLVLGKS